MGVWGTALFSDDLALDIRREYGLLLATGKSDREAEKMLIDYYSDILCLDDADKDVFWIVLAICEWKKGRLSPFVKEQALSSLKDGRDLQRWNYPGKEKDYEKRKKVLREVEKTILSPMPPAKKQKKPWVRRCPWKVGSLLAYRIVSSEDHLRGCPSYGKYVLLRVVKVYRRPLSTQFDTGYYNESMMVGLYNWIGDELPDPEIVRDLKYIPVENGALVPPRNGFDISLANALPEESRKKIETAIGSFLKGGAEKCVWLDWRPPQSQKETFFLLHCDEEFETHLPDFFAPEPASRTYTHCLAFDLTLSRKFDPYLQNASGAGYILIE